MASEVKSFVMKFKNLWKAGRNANLTINSNAGKASVTLQIVDLEIPHDVYQHKRSRNGAAQQRRRERRAAARETAEKVIGETAGVGDPAVEATAHTEKDKNDANDLSGKGELGNKDYEAKDTTLPEYVAPNSDAEKGSENVIDEFCPDNIYVENVDDTLVEDILITTDCDADWKDDNMENLIYYKLKIIGINMVKINRINRSNNGAFTSCLVKIQPIPVKKIEILSLNK